jgi:hypothetical protein
LAAASTVKVTGALGVTHAIDCGVGVVGVGGVVGCVGAVGIAGVVGCVGAVGVVGIVGVVLDCTPMTGQVGLGESGGVCRYSLD